VECDGTRGFLDYEDVDDMRHEGAHGCIIDTVDRGAVSGLHDEWSPHGHQKGGNEEHDDH
jgi:hypothetical protein